MTSSSANDNLLLSIEEGVENTKNILDIETPLLGTVIVDESFSEVYGVDYLHQSLRETYSVIFDSVANFSFILFSVIPGLIIVMVYGLLAGLVKFMIVGVLGPCFKIFAPFLRLLEGCLQMTTNSICRPCMRVCGVTLSSAVIRFQKLPDIEAGSHSAVPVVRGETLPKLGNAQSKGPTPGASAFQEENIYEN